MQQKLPEATKVIVGMSGGVDSSVAAYLLLQQGYQVTGLFMKNWEEDDNDKYCAAAEDLKDAQQVCDKLGIELHSVNFAAEYWDNVFEHFLAEYQAGRTPNPDILCNKEIKFKAFLEFAEQILAADFIATGHYVGKQHNNEYWQLLRGIDSNKDQSYFLYQLQQAQLAKALFPLGKYSKPQIRQIAAEQGFITYNKKDSTGICFIGERKFNDFLERYLPAQPGIIKTTDGVVIGEHQGLMFHTIGQRKGLGIGGLKTADESPWYVAEKNVAENSLIVVQGANHPLLFKQTFIVNQLSWTNEILLDEPIHCSVKIRYRSQDCQCLLTPCTEHGYLIELKQPQKAITPGQSAVFYDGNVCLGGGIIEG